METKTVKSSFNFKGDIILSRETAYYKLGYCTFRGTSVMDYFIFVHQICRQI